MDNQQLKDWQETAIMVERKRLAMCVEADKLKRRERISTAFMAAMLSNPEILDSFSGYNIIAIEAIEQTDALISALDKDLNP